MDLEILQQVQQLFIKWTNKQQTGMLLISTQQLVWMTPDGIEVDLTTLLQPTHNTSVNNSPSVSKRDKRLQEYYDLGKSIQLQPDQPVQQSRATIRTAQRVYDFYQFIGEQHLGKLHSITPSRLNWINNTQFETLKLDTLASHISFGGPQAGVGDDLSSV